MHAPLGIDPVIRAKARAVKCLILDVDGVLTDGSLVYSARGEELKTFNVHDGTSLKWLQRAGLDVVFLTGRKSPQTEARATELQITECIQGALYKLPPFEDFLKRRNLEPNQVAYMGDDLIDLPVLTRAGLSLAPADAAEDVRIRVDWVSRFPGGHGAVREASEMMLKAQDKWEEITTRYFE